MMTEEAAMGHATEGWASTVEGEGTASSLPTPLKGRAAPKCWNLNLLFVL